ncbi:ABC-F family ATP-binding cassette domain-containing protein [Thiomonas sp.]|uniref:ABC-F family ATP-binding cassette domain-containing protein n=1 Tax=Thiomonas sp. TaxID=2047785 RepID=UPI002613346E|nr:ATP-binding cassette domain-containing protein [Thiomonas sp.]
MSIVSCQELSLAYGVHALLDRASMSLEAGERVGLIGRNGSGKSSLLRIIAGTESPDAGELRRQQGLRLVYVAQEPQLQGFPTVFDAVAEGVAEARALRQRFEAHASGEDLDALQTRIELLDGWNWEQRVQEVLQRLGLEPGAEVAALSGGQQKRVALAQALAASPDVLLLDEPTNHLDLDAIQWLEQLLAGFRGSVLVISHDRAFIDAVVTRIVELDRGVLRSYPGNYAAFEQRKARELADEALAQARADKLLAQEEEWIRRGVEARRTRSVGRVQRLQQLRQQRAQRREALGSVRLELDRGEASGRMVAELQGVSKAFGDQQVVRDLSAIVLRGDKVGILGPNGAGKTTLLKLLLGDLAPDRGTVRQGSRLQVAYFDQMRAALDPEATLADTISPGSEWIEIGGARKHVSAYLGDFLFPPSRARSPVKSLSGGERNRLLLARLFARPANVVVLDEPTNDLDMDTIELLEQLLQDFPGTVFLVSHDRRFLDNVVTSTLAWESAGSWREYEGGVEDWLAQRQRVAQAAAASSSSSAAASVGASASTGASGSAPVTQPASAPRAAAAAGTRRKLSYKEQRELEQLPARIEQLEQEQGELTRRLADPALYRDQPQLVAAMRARFDAIEQELGAALQRWQDLEDLGAPG